MSSRRLTHFPAVRGRNSMHDWPRIGGLPGIKIGDGAMVGAGSLVNSDIPPGTLAAGVPARVIRGGLNRRMEEIHEYPK